MAESQSLLAGRARLRVPLVTATLVAAVASTGWRLGVMHHEIGLTTAYRYGLSGRLLALGHWGTLVTSQLLSRDLFMCVSLCISLVLMLGAYEVFAGSRRAAAVAVVGGLAGPAVVVAALAAGSALGMPLATSAFSTLDYGASAITAAGGGAFVGLMRRRWLTVGAVAFVVGGLVLHHQMADWEHLVSFPVGLLLARRLGVPKARSAPLRFAVPFAMPSAGLVGSAAMGLIASASTVLSPLPAGASASASAVVSVAVGVGVAPGGPGGPEAPAEPVVTTGPLSPVTVLERHYPSPALGRDRRVLVQLPRGYAEQPGRRYPVIEFLHGSPGDPADAVTGLGLPDLAEHGGLPAFIAVSPDGRGPDVDYSDWADAPTQKVGAAVSDDLRAWVDATFRTNREWSVTGLSAGGFGAAYLGMRSPGAYQSVCAMSGYYQPRSPAFAREPAPVRDAASPLLHATPDGPRTLLVVGAGDADGMAEAEHYLAALRGAGQVGELAVKSGKHEWSVWQSATIDCLRFLLTPPPGTAHHSST